MRVESPFHERWTATGSAAGAASWATRIAASKANLKVRSPSRASYYTSDAAGMKFQRIILVEVLNRREREVNGSALFQVVAALLGLSLIGASIYISTHASAPPRRAARAPAPPVEPSEFAADPEPAPDPAPQPISHPDSVPS